MQDPHCQLDPCILRDRLHSAESLLGGVITLTGLAKITEIQTRALSESCPSSSYYQMGQDYALSWLGFDTPLREFGGFALRKSGCLGLNGDVRRDYLLGILDGTSRFRAQSNLAYIR